MLMIRSFLLTALLFGGGVAHAAVILEVDVSDPNAVVFTSTSAFAQNDVSGASSAAGIFLVDFFSGNTVTLDTPVDSGAIDVFDSAAGTSRRPLNQIFVSSGGSQTLDDLNLYGTGGGGFLMYFFDNQTALTGSATGDLSTLSGFRAPGASGNISAGSEVIGQWAVVPEPSTAALMGLGLVGLAVQRRRA